MIEEENENKKFNNIILEKWEELKVIIDSSDLDIVSCAGGNVTAGKRARKGLRLIKKEAAELVKLTNNLGKIVKDQRKKAREEN